MKEVLKKYKKFMDLSEILDKFDIMEKLNFGVYVRSL